MEKLKPKAERTATNTKVKMIARKTGSGRGKLAGSILRAPLMPTPFVNLGEICCYNPKCSMKSSNGRNWEEYA